MKFSPTLLAVGAKCFYNSPWDMKQANWEKCKLIPTLCAMQVLILYVLGVYSCVYTREAVEERVRDRGEGFYM